MIELPYFKFYPSQWVTGDINYLSYELQGAFIQACCHYWSKDCEMTYNKLIMRIDKKLIDQLIELKLITNNKKINIKFMDEQHKERKTAHNLRVENGRKGGNATAKLKQSSSNTTALRKEKIKKEKKYSDPALNNEKGINEFLKQRNDNRTVK
jgi:hypothetical protein